MGWDSWYANFGGVSDADVRAAADAVVLRGLKSVGYQYININACWQGSRDSQGNILPDNTRFPDMKGLADYVHSRGLKFGIYSSPGPTTCCGDNLGSYQHEQQDADTFAAWGVDFLKYDDACSGQNFNNAQTYKTMGGAIAKTGRPMVLALASEGWNDWTWAQGAGTNMWRVNHDIIWPLGNLPLYQSILETARFDSTLGSLAGPGHWNDPDMLVLNTVVCHLAHTSNQAQIPIYCLTQDEEMTQVTLWAILAAPLIESGDIANMTQADLNLLANPEVVAVDQDVLGKQGSRVWADANGAEIWQKQLSDGTAYALVNTAPADQTITLNVPQSKLRDLWQHQDLGSLSSYTTNVVTHGVVLLKASQ
jgi:alpha-galactosidase